MLAVLMAFFALALSVGTVVVVRLTLSESVATARRMDSLSAQLAKLSLETPEALKAELDDLRAALDVTRASNRKEFGSLWGRLGGKPRKDEAADAEPVGDASFQALLDLQVAPVAGP